MDMRLELFGNLGRDPEAKYTPQGKMVVTASAAVTIGYGENKKTEWVKLTVWEKTGELFNKLCQKGTTIWVSGTPKVSVWKDKEGEPKAQLELTVKEFKVLKGFRQDDDSQIADDDVNPF